jgi:hypothetical protein
MWARLVETAPRAFGAGWWLARRRASPSPVSDAG